MKLHHNTHHHNTKPHGFYFVTVLHIICGSSLLFTPDDGYIDARNMLRWINFVVASTWIIPLPSFTMHGHMNVKSAINILSLFFAVYPSYIGCLLRFILYSLLEALWVENLSRHPGNYGTLLLLCIPNYFDVYVKQTIMRNYDRSSHNIFRLMC
jgi:hypothetical protein